MDIGFYLLIFFTGLKEKRKLVYIKYILKISCNCMTGLKIINIYHIIDSGVIHSCP